MFVVYNIESTMIVHPNNNRFATGFKTATAAKSAITRNKLDKNLYAIAPAKEFFESIEKKEVRNNLMSGLPFTTGVNSPRSCDPSSETYWCS